MTYEPIFKAAPGFNARAAKEAYDLVMKMDEDQAEVFINMVVSNVVEETITKNLRTVQGHLNKVVKTRVDKVRKAMVSKAMSDPDATMPYASAFAEISKAINWDEKLHPRSQGGQFRTKVSHAQKKPLHPKTAKTVGIKGTDDADYKKLTGAQKAQYQDEYRQLANFLNTVNQSSRNPGDSTVVVHFKANRGGQEWYEANNGTKVDRKMINPREHKIVGIEARPNTLSLGGAAFGLSSALGGGTPPVGGINTVDARLRSGFADDWMSAGDPMNPNTRTFGRIQSGSELIGELAPPGSKVQMASRFGQFVGEHGPEAEKVFGPHARKTAYRYRGTSKKPELQLMRDYNTAVVQAKVGSDVGRQNLSMGQQALRRQAAVNRAATDQELGAGRAVVAEYLRERIPDRGLYNLQLHSGTTPPSEGVLINSDGRIVDQAIGYGDDHYLPFNLRNLKSLRGGEYIRTRSVGGPTAEDIYTGLMSGAKRMTVVSRSGTFTVNFEPDFKGGRRYNDKALRMTRRYEQILDAVQSEQVDKENIKPHIRNAIIEEVKRDYAGESSEVLQGKVNERIEDFKRNPELSAHDERLAQFIAAQRASGSQGRDANSFMREVMNEIAREKEFKFRLNGNGYESALMALREQFPYYITVDAIPVREGEESLDRDRGYVEPGRLKPTEARGAGLYGTGINPGLKRQGLGSSSASRMHYQDRKGQGRAGGQGTPREPAKEPEKVEGDKVPESAEVKAETVVRNIRQKQAVRAAGVDLYKAIKAADINADLFPIMALPEDQFAARAGDPAGARELGQVAEALEAKRNQLTPEVLSAMDKFKRAVGGADAREFEPALALTWGAAPYEFGGKGYKKEDSPEDRGFEVRRINERTKSVLFGGNLSSLTNQKMQEEVEALRDIYRIVNDNPELQSTDPKMADARKRIRESLMGQYDAEATGLLLEKPEKLLRRMEDVHRMRALMDAGGWSEDQREQINTARSPTILAPPTVEPGSLATKTEDTEMMRGRVRQAIKVERDRLANIPESEWSAQQEETWRLTQDAGLMVDDMGSDELMETLKQFMENRRGS